MNEAGKIARSLGLSVVLGEIRRVDDIVPAIAGLNGQVDALYVVVDNLIAANYKLLIAQALGARLPTMVNNREFVQAGALMSYGPNFPALFRRAADFVDKIFRGTKPGDIPVEQPTKFDFTINLTTAKALDLSVPASVLSLADEVIE